MQSESKDTMDDRLARIRERMAAACGRAGRNPDEVRLLAVSKTQPPERVAEAFRAGLTVFGENRVQEAAAKIPLCPSPLEWHLIGHLQGNKAKAAVSLFQMIHSVDSVALLDRINRLCEEAGRDMPVCLEINVSGEASKFGMPPEEVPAALEQAVSMMRVSVVGLMTMPPYAEDPGRARHFFQTLRALRDRCRAQTGFDLPELSMGMSHDFEVAIEEGATWIRVGSALFGERG